VAFLPITRSKRGTIMKQRKGVASSAERKRWLHHVAARKASGDSRAAYCRKHGLHYHQLRDWELRNGKASESRATKVPKAFVRVERPETRRGGLLRLTLPGGISIDVSDGFDMTQIAQLLVAVRSGA
jgi:hypothetical protein